MTDFGGSAILVALRFEWDEHKNAQNQRKHSISFEECVELFTSGVDYLEVFDRAHSEDEDRFICIGPIGRGVVLVVVVVLDDEVVRLVSARLATRRESDLFLAYATRGRTR